MAYQNMLKKLRAHPMVIAAEEIIDEPSTELSDSGGHKAPFEMVKKTSLCNCMNRKILNIQKKKVFRANDSNQTSYNDPKKAIEFLIILAEIRHEMNRAGHGEQRMPLYSENTSNSRKTIWKRICRFLRIKADREGRTELRRLIANFRNIDTEFRKTYDYYVGPDSTSPELPANRSKNIENDPVAIQQEVILKVQLMQKYLEHRVKGGGGDEDMPNINLVHHLDEVIDAFSKLTE